MRPVFRLENINMQHLCGMYDCRTGRPLLVMDYACGSYGQRCVWRQRVACHCPGYFYHLASGSFYFCIYFLWRPVHPLPVHSHRMDHMEFQELYKMIPYVVTLVVLVLTSMRNKRENQPPSSLGQSYFREER